MRKLAHIEAVTNIRPIEGYDRVEQVNILGWNVIVQKGQFKEGDKAVYVEIDSIVPNDNPNFAFLEKRNYKIKTQKMCKTISQGIVFSMDILPEGNYEIGDDVTEILKITQIEDEVPATHSVSREQREKQFKAKHKKFFKNPIVKYFMKYSWFRKIVYSFMPKKTTKKHGYPSYIVKTDEIRLQNMPWVLESCKDTPMIVTEKLDGTSSTFGLQRINKNKFDFAVCSRNVRQETPDKVCYYADMPNVYWEMAFKYDIENVLKDIQRKYDADTVVIQGETIGEGIQKNKYQIKGHDLYVFNLIINGERVNSVEARDILKEYGMKFVPILVNDFILLDNVNDMIEYADGKSEIYDTLREGVVIRNYDKNISFKCISNKFLLKHNL
jgi:hypothetical protein